VKQSSERECERRESLRDDWRVPPEPMSIRRTSFSRSCVTPMSGPVPFLTPPSSPINVESPLSPRNNSSATELDYQKLDEMLCRTSKPTPPSDLWSATVSEILPGDSASVSPRSSNLQKPKFSAMDDFQVALSSGLPVQVYETARRLYMELSVRRFHMKSIVGGPLEASSFVRSLHKTLEPSSRTVYFGGEPPLEVQRVEVDKAMRLVNLSDDLKALEKTIGRLKDYMIRYGITVPKFDMNALSRHSDAETTRSVLSATIPDKPEDTSLEIWSKIQPALRSLVYLFSGVDQYLGMALMTSSHVYSPTHLLFDVVSMSDVRAYSYFSSSFLSIGEAKTFSDMGIVRWTLASTVSMPVVFRRAVQGELAVVLSLPLVAGGGGPCQVSMVASVMNITENCSVLAVSTTPGQSGSLVVSVEDNAVIGLHDFGHAKKPVSTFTTWDISVSLERVLAASPAI